MALMYSYYGGKPGTTYQIVQHFDSVYDMVKAFQQGGSYNKVKYGQYVIIDTIVNKNHYNSPQNGLLYRRGLNYNEEFNPNGVELSDNTSVSKDDTRFYETATKGQDKTTKFNLDKFRDVFSSFVMNPGGGAEYIGQIVGPQGSISEAELLNWTDFSKTQKNPIDSGTTTFSPITPGAVVDSNGQASSYNDQIKFGYADIKDENGNIQKFLISFDIPYSVFSIHAESESPYTGTLDRHNTDDRNKWTWSYNNLIKEENASKNHPYYWQYDIKIPKGIQGKSLESIELETTGKTTNGGNDIDQSDHNYQYYYQIRDYSTSQEGEVLPQKIFIDSFNRSIYRITDDRIDRNNNYAVLSRNTAYEKGQKVLLSGQQDKGLICIKAGTTSATQPNFDLNNDTVFIDGTVKWQLVKNGEVPSNITVHYTHGTNETFDTRFVENIIYSKEDGNFYIKYSNSNRAQSIGAAPSIRSIEITDENDLSKDHNVKLTYNDDSTAIVNKEPFNNIASIKRYGDNFIVLYSDPRVRKALYDKEKDYAISAKDPNYNEGTGDDDGKGNLYWINLGECWEGGHIFGNYDTLDDLKAAYPNGFEGNRAGWTATVGANTGEDKSKTIYAFDYNGKEWYPVQSVGGGNSYQEVNFNIGEDENGVQQQLVISKRMV